jgi:1,4-alpha-glucan branching enzyme
MSVTSFVRKSAAGAPVLVVTNFTPVPRSNFLLGIPQRGIWRELLNSDAREYGGSGWGNLGSVESSPISAHGRLEALTLNLPPLATIMLRWEANG